MRGIRIVLRLLAILLTGVILSETVKVFSASPPGFPDSLDTGVGVVLSPGTSPSKGGLATPGQVNWVQIHADWSVLQPYANREWNWRLLDPLIAQAQQQQLPVLLSLSHAPTWALTVSGPKPALVRQAVLALLQQYPSAIYAIELFPEANTTAGWGARPDPRAYLSLYTHIQETLIEKDILLIALGLTPLNHSPAPEDIDDLDYLEAFYREPNAAQVPVISLRLHGVASDPAASPAYTPQLTLRHYEQVRALMQYHHHEDGMLWLTYVSPTSDIIQNRSSWRSRVIQQVQRLLYLGAVFFAPGSSSAGSGPTTSPEWYKTAPKQSIFKSSHATTPSNTSGMAILAHYRF